MRVTYLRVGNLRQQRDAHVCVDERLSSSRLNSAPLWREKYRNRLTASDIVMSLPPEAWESRVRSSSREQVVDGVHGVGKPPRCSNTLNNAGLPTHASTPGSIPSRVSSQLTPRPWTLTP